MSYSTHRVVNDKWNIDWNIVHTMCPEYEKFLYNNLPDEEDGRAINLDPMEIQRNEDGAMRARYGGKAITDQEEQEIIEMLHSAGDNPKDQLEQEVDVLAQYYDNGDRGLKDDWYLKEEHVDNHLAGVSDPGVPLLPIPKRYLDIGSNLRYGAGIQYTFGEVKTKDPNVVGFNKFRINIFPHKVQLVRIRYYFDRVKNFMSEKKDFTQFVTFSEKTKGIYWTRYVQKKPAKRAAIRYRKAISRLGMRSEGLMNSLRSFPTLFILLFLEEVVRRAKRDLGDIYLPGSILEEKPSKTSAPRVAGRKVPVIAIPEESLRTMRDTRMMAMFLSAVAWQYKAKRPLRWVENPLFLENLSSIMATHNLNKILLDSQDPIDAAIAHVDNDVLAARKRSILRKIHSTVQNNSSPKPILKVIMGELYKDYYHKLLSSMLLADGSGFGNLLDFKTIIDMESGIRGGKVPPICYQFFVELFNTLDDEVFFENTSLEHIHSLNGAVMSNLGYNDLDRFIKFNRRMFHSGNKSIGWNHFRDTLRMAEEFGIRVRLNKCNSSSDLMRFHDKLSSYARRDKKALRTAPVFFPFKHPDKLYNGFSFVHLSTAQDLKDEAHVMKNCVAGYAHRCFSGNSLIFSMRNGRSWVTIELDGNDTEYKILQKYTIGDFSINNGDFLKLIDEWHKDLVNIHANKGATYGQIVRNIHQYLTGLSIPDDSDLPFSDLADNQDVARLKEAMSVDVNEKRLKALQELKAVNISEEEVLEYAKTIEQSAAQA